MNQSNVETEWQFEVDDLERVRAWLESQPEHAPLRFTLIKDAEQVDSYYDTGDWRLFFAGYSLRRRRKDERYEVTLKSLERASEGPISRREINEHSPEGEIPAPHGVPGPVSDRVRIIAGRAPLVRLFEVRTWRRSYAVRQGDETLAQVELDETIVAPQSAPVSTFRRVEVEMSGGAPTPDIEAFVLAMRYANALTPTSTSKYEAGLQVASLDPTRVLDFGPQTRGPRAGAAEYAYGWLREQWAAFLRHAPGTRIGEDIEALHQMRVATRRLRASIRVFESVLPQTFEGYRAELQWVGHELGAVRDLDVQIESLEKLRAASSWDDAAALRPLIEVIERERRVEREQLVELLDSERYDGFVRSFSSVLREGPPIGTESPEIYRYAEPILARRFRRLRTDGKRLTDASPAVEYHELRIRGKRLRYSLEVFGELYGRPAERATAALKALQDMLGDHQDAEVGIERLHTIIRAHGRELPPESLVAVGQLIERYRQQEGALRADFPRDFERVLERWRSLARVAAEAVRAKPGRGQGAGSPEDSGTASGTAVTPVETTETSVTTDEEPGLPVTTEEPAGTPTRADVAPWPRPAPPATAPREDPNDAGTLSRMRQLFHRE